MLKENRSYFYSYGFLGLSQILGGLTPLILGFMASTHGEMGSYGVYALAFSLGVFSSVVADAGSNSIIVQRIVKRENIKRIVNSYFGSIITIKVILYIVTSALVVSYVSLSANLVGNMYIFLIYQGFGFALCIQPMFLFIIWNRLHISSLIVATTKVPILIYVLYFFKVEAEEYRVVAFLDFTMMGVAVLAQYIYGHSALGFWPVIERRLFLPLISVLKYFYLANLASATYHRLHYFFVVAYGDPKALGLIAIIDRAISIWGQLYNPAVTLLIPKLVRSTKGSITFLSVVKKSANIFLPIVLVSLVVVSFQLYIESSAYVLLESGSEAYAEGYNYLIFFMIGLICITMFYASISGYPIASLTGRYQISQISIYLGFTTSLLFVMGYELLDLNGFVVLYALIFMLVGELAVFSLRLYYLNKFSTDKK